MRFCIDCGVDISGRGNAAKRCTICSWQNRKKTHAATNARWKLNNPEKEKERARRWALNNPAKTREKARRWRLTNPEKVVAVKRSSGKRRYRRSKYLITTGIKIGYLTPGPIKKHITHNLKMIKKVMKYNIRDFREFGQQ